jgi:hypothetical protein
MVSETTIRCHQCGREHVPFTIPKHADDQTVIVCDFQRVKKNQRVKKKQQQPLVVNW